MDNNDDNLSDLNTMLSIPAFNEEEKFPLEHCMNCDVCVEELDHH